MKQPEAGQGSKGSSPIGHPNSTRVSGVNTDSLKNGVRDNLAHLAHFGLSDVAPGGETKQEQMQKQISINTTGKRWYVSYYVESPEGKMVRRRSYGRVNVVKDLKLRMELLLQLQQDVFNSLLKKQDPLDKDFLNSLSIYRYIDMIIADKRRYLKKNSIKTLEHHLGVFKKWLLESNNEYKHPSEVKRPHIIAYRNWQLKKGIGNRTINNNMREVAGLFNYIIDSDDSFAFKSPLYKLKKLPSRSETHVTYTTNQFQRMMDYMKENDPKLLFFIKLIAFAYLRSDEAKYLRIRDIDLSSRKITLTAKANKTNKRTQKIIQEIIVDEFEKRNLSQYSGDYFLFSRSGQPGPIPVGENYFRKRFRKVKKIFGLSRLHTIYGFRHTSVSQLLEGGTKWHKAMDLTGHEDMSSFQKYARNILGRQPEDHSSIYKVVL